MPADSKRALVERLNLAAAAAVESTAKRAVRQPDTLIQPDMEPASAEETFRRCTEQGWNHSAWQYWLDWSNAVSNLRGGDWFKSANTVDSKYAVHRFGKSDDALCYDYGTEFGRDRALEILAELHQQEILANFENFWDTIHAALQFSRLSPTSLRMDSEIYGGHFGLVERRQHAVEFLQRKGLACR